MVEEQFDQSLINLGFTNKGEFDIDEFDIDDFDNICEIGSFVVAIQPEYTAILYYTEMVYWDVANSSIELVLKEIQLIAEHELKRYVQRQNDAVVKKGSTHD